MLSTPCAFFVTICYSSTLLLLLSCYHHFFPRAPLSSYGFIYLKIQESLLLRASALAHAHNSSLE